MPIQYSGIIEEHRAVRSAAGLFDLSHMGELVVEGEDAGAALAGALVSDPPSLAVGRAHYSMICAPDGGILDDLIVYRLAEDRFMVVANASNARAVSDALAERLDGFRAVLDDRSLATGLVAVQGPRSLDILRPADRARPGGDPLLRDRGGDRGGDPGPGRPHRLHGRGRVRAVRRRRPAPASCGTRCWRPGGRTARCRWASGRATRCGSRRACRSTATSWTATTNPFEAASGGS